MLILAAIAPSVSLLYYFYLRDKYEKEPRKLLIKAFLLGCLIVLPVLFFEFRLNIFDYADRSVLAAGYSAFVVAGLVEESFKYLAFSTLIYKNREFNEMYDGIVYCVFISLGFATVENIAYVMTSGFNTALVRALTAVPAHALFGVVMGYYFGISKFVKKSRKNKYIFYAWIVPLLLHGTYDFILFSQRFLALVIFVPYMLYLWFRALKHVDELVEASPFKQPTKGEN